jgi:WD40 repeat protein
MLQVQLNIQTAEIYTCAFAPNGMSALTGSHGNSVGLWVLTRGSLVRPYEHTGSVWALAWSSDQRSFLSVDGTLRLWEVDTGKCLREYDGRHARCVAWSADQKQALAASNGTLLLTDLQSGERLRELEGHADGIYCAAFDWNGQRALTGSRDRAVRVWDLRNGPLHRGTIREGFPRIVMAFGHVAVRTPPHESSTSSEPNPASY